MIKKAIKLSFGKMYDIASITVAIKEDSINNKYEDVIAVIVEKDMTIKKLVFSTYWETCYEYNYVANVAIKTEMEWMYEEFTKNLEILVEG